MSKHDPGRRSDRSVRPQRVGAAVAGGLLAAMLVPAPSQAASLTPPNLTAATSISSGDLMLVWPSSSGGPLKQVQWSVLQSQMQSALGSAYLQVGNNLSDISSAATARSNLGLGSAALAVTGTSGHVLPFLDGTVTVSGPWTWSSKLITAPSAAGGAGFNLTPGVAPSTPVNGDCWLTSTAVSCRVGGVSQQFLFAANNLSDLGNVASARGNLGLGTAALANTGVSGGAVPLLNAANTWSAVQAFPANDLQLSGVTGSVQCLQASATGVVTGTGAACGSGSGTVGTSGSPISGNLVQFSGPSTITSGNLAGDCTTSGTLAVTCLKTNGSSFGTFATANAATPPAIGGTTPAAGSFTTLSASSSVSGAGFSAYLASPPAIGGTTPAGGAFTSLSASGSVSGAGFAAYLASPPAIGGTSASSGTFTSLSTSAAATASRTGIGATSTDALVLQNTTAAAAGAQQWSPRLHLIGQGWKTNATAASQTVDWIAEVQPLQGAASPTANLVFSSQINGAGFTPQVTFPSSGGVSVAAGATYQVNGAQIGCGNLANATTACSTTVGTAGAVIPLLSTANSWSSTQSLLAGGDSTTVAAQGYALRIRGDSSAGPGILQFTDNAGATQWGTLSSTSTQLSMNKPLNVVGAITQNGTAVALSNDSRFSGPPQNSQSAAYTLSLGDAGGQVYHPTSDTTARTWTIPANASVAFPVVTKIELVNDCSAGAITLSITSDVLVWFPTGGSGARTIAACGMATLTKVSATRWIITGTGIS